MQLSQTLYSFYDHNFLLVWYGGLAILCLVLSLVRGSRYYMWLFVAFFILTFKFEYDKHLFSKIKTDMLDLVFPPSARFRKYNYIRLFLEVYLPIFMDFIGWGIVALVFIFNKPASKKD